MKYLARTTLLLSFLAVACGSALAIDLDASRGSGVDAGAPEAAAPVEASADAGGEASASPSDGRTASIVCSAARQGSPGTIANEPTFRDGGACEQDSDCDGGATPRCDVLLRESLHGTPPGALCTHSTCARDEDCPGATSVCACGIGFSGQNVCLTKSNCRTDRDCPTGERCAFSHPPVLDRAGGIWAVERGDEVTSDPNYSGNAVGYFCTTPADACTLPKPDLAVKCIYYLPANHWGWGYTY